MTDLEQRLAAYRLGDPDARELSDRVLFWFGWKNPGANRSTDDPEYPDWISPDGIFYTKLRPHPVASLDASAALMPEDVAIVIDLPYGGGLIAVHWRWHFMTSPKIVTANTEQCARILAAMATREVE